MKVITVLYRDQGTVYSTKANNSGIYEGSKLLGKKLSKKNIDSYPTTITLITHNSATSRHNLLWVEPKDEDRNRVTVVHLTYEASNSELLKMDYCQQFSKQTARLTARLWMKSGVVVLINKQIVK